MPLSYTWPTVCKPATIRDIMYVAPGLLYLHAPRTAGTFVTNTLERGGVGSRSVEGLGVHDGIRKIPERMASDKLIFGSIRDPWSWYVSYFSSFKNAKTGTLTGPLADLCGNQSTFQNAIKMMTRPYGQGMMVIPKLPGCQNAVEPKIGKTLSKAGIGLWSWYMITMFCLEEIETIEGLSSQMDENSDLPWSVPILLDAATIEIGLEQVLSAWGGPKHQEASTFLKTAPPINESSGWKGVRPSGAPDPRWWSEESIKTIHEVDGWMMRRFSLHEPVGKRPVLHTFGG